MIVTGTVLSILPIEEGTSKTGKAWRKGGVVIDVTNNWSYPKMLLLTLFGRGIDNVKVEVGMKYDFDIDVTSREWTNEKTGKTSWFTEATAFNATLNDTGAMTNQPPVQQTQQTMNGYQQANMMYGSQAQTSMSPQPQLPPEDDDLPF